MISVLLYPLIGLTLRRRSRGGAPLPPDDEHVPVEA
jgi:hypothetical protein